MSSVALLTHSIKEQNLFSHITYTLCYRYEKINIMDFVYWLRFTDRSGKSEELLNALEHYNLKK